VGHFSGIGLEICGRGSLGICGDGRGGSRRNAGFCVIGPLLGSTATTGFNRHSKPNVPVHSRDRARHTARVAGPAVAAADDGFEPGRLKREEADVLALVAGQSERNQGQSRAIPAHIAPIRQFLPDRERVLGLGPISCRKPILRHAGVLLNGARRIRTADLLGAISACQAALRRSRSAADGARYARICGDCRDVQAETRISA
jgi:hypothetical protein